MKIVNWKYIQRRDLIIGGLASAVLTILSVIWGDWLFGFIGGLGTFGHLLAYYVMVLNRRVETDNGAMWNVDLNGVKVGTITDQDYAAIRVKVFTNWRNYVAQLAIMLLAMIFWYLIMEFILTPETFALILTNIVLRVTLLIIPFFILISAMIFGGRYGFGNQFSKNTEVILRQKLDITAEGTLSIHRCTDELVSLKQ